MNWAIFALMFPHLKPKCIKFFSPIFYRVWDGFRVLSLLILVFLFVRRFTKDKKLPSPVSWVIGVLEGWICLNTLIKHGDYVEVFSLAVSAMGIVLLADYYADRITELLTSLMLNYEWIMYVNLITVLKYPHLGVTQDWEYCSYFNGTPIYFFDSDNGFMYLCIPAVCVALLYLRMKLAQGQKIAGIMRSVSLTTASYACVFILKPTTTMVAMAVIAMVMVVALIPGIRRCVIFPVAFVCGIAANLAIVVFRVAETQPFLAELIQTKLKKTVTFSGRTPIWDWFQAEISGHLLTGLGNPEGGYLIEEKFLDHIHNQYYDLLALGGIIALLFFLAAVVLVGIEATRHHKTWSARIMTAVFSGFFIMCIPEVCRLGSIFLLFPLAYHVGKLEVVCKPSPPPLPESDTTSGEKLHNDNTD